MTPHYEDEVPKRLRRKIGAEAQTPFITNSKQFNQESASTDEFK